MQIEQLKPIIEAALLASSQPMTVHQLGDLFNEADDVSPELIARALEALAGDCEGRGVELKEVASGFRYQVRQDVHAWISRMWTEKPSRYSRALLETLALIAYRQPITRPEIEQIRGVVVSSNIIKTMEEREWIRVVGYRDVPGKPALFGTTRAFLDYFNLKSLDQLPPLSEIRDMEDPQLRFEQEPLPVRIARDLPIDPDGDDQAESAAASESDNTESDEVAEPAADTADHHETNQPDADPSDASTESNEHRSETSALDKSNPSTADEAATPADVESDDADQDTEEYRA
ncbi:segregation and condensation protein B [Rhodanobacter sp. ANJX3]|jgi:segregation and condensation protein B|uniref:SMC-Scp complex subunit ScpB n=1 Tax=unclassified Rhodanobacter TaxID=2621553 RepID=UPI0015C79871|nr:MULTISPECIES: SMC-Scp complex subunit ScpB [unclassified Rhodanobacter]MBB5357800.1 segregation and condensation protein B [Rhodanobacter sp. ANJX3]NYE30428.1 segregation and condensation protein B [Rhodanobacter sp. K2T2]